MPGGFGLAKSIKLALDGRRRLWVGDDLGHLHDVLDRVRGGEIVESRDVVVGCADVVVPEGDVVPNRAHCLIVDDDQVMEGWRWRGGCGVGGVLIRLAAMTWNCIKTATSKSALVFPWSFPVQIPMDEVVRTYGEKIGVEMDGVSGGEGLRKIVEAHIQTFAWGDLSLHTQDENDMPELDDDAIAKKLLVDGKDGWCIEHNGLLLRVLRAVGYDAHLVFARVNVNGVNVHAEPGPEKDQILFRERDTHVLVLVVLAQDDVWVCDVGLGVEVTTPIPLGKELSLLASAKLRGGSGVWDDGDLGEDGVGVSSNWMGLDGWEGVSDVVVGVNTSYAVGFGPIAGVGSDGVEGGLGREDAKAFGLLSLIDDGRWVVMVAFHAVSKEVEDCRAMNEHLVTDSIFVKLPVYRVRQGGGVEELAVVGDKVVRVVAAGEGVGTVHDRVEVVDRRLGVGGEGGGEEESRAEFLSRVMMTWFGVDVEVGAWKEGA